MQGPAVFMDISLEDQVLHEVFSLYVNITSPRQCLWCHRFLSLTILYHVPCLFQALELRKYFKSLGAEIADEKSPNGVEDDLHKIVGVCDACFKDNTEADVEAILNSIVSIMVSVSLL